MVGSKAIKITMIPRPPIQCSQIRQNNKLVGHPSISDRAVAPVVVNPDMASKNAPKGSSISVIIKGSDAKRAAVIHVNTTVRIPSLFVIS